MIRLSNHAQSDEKRVRTRMNAASSGALSKSPKTLTALSPSRNSQFYRQAHVYLVLLTTDK